MPALGTATLLEWKLLAEQLPGSRHVLSSDGTIAFGTFEDTKIDVSTHIPTVDCVIGDSSAPLTNSQVVGPVQHCTIKSNEPKDNFGVSSLRIDGDFMVIGALRISSGRVGAAYVYRKTPSGWEFFQSLQYPGTGTNYGNSGFGRSVAISGDMIAVGAHLELNQNGHNRGNIFLYRFDGTSWNYEQSNTGRDGHQYAGWDVELANNTLAFPNSGNDYRIIARDRPSDQDPYPTRFGDIVIPDVNGNLRAYIYPTHPLSLGLNEDATIMAMGGMKRDASQDGANLDPFPVHVAWRPNNDPGTAWTYYNVLATAEFTTLPIHAKSGAVSGRTVVVCFTGYPARTYEESPAQTGVWVQAHVFSGVECATASIDGNTIILGVHGSNKAIVYERVGSSQTWSMVRELVDTSGDQSAGFGFLAGISGNSIAVSKSGALVDSVSIYTEIDDSYPCAAWPNYLDMPFWKQIVCPGRGFSGTIPLTIEKATGLEKIDLSGNNLVGGIPQLQDLSKLTDLNLQNNQFSGAIPFNAFFNTKLSQVGSSIRIVEGNCLQGNLFNLRAAYDNDLWVPNVDFDPILKPTDSIPKTTACFPTSAPTDLPTAAPTRSPTPKPTDLVESTWFVPVITGLMGMMSFPSLALFYKCFLTKKKSAPEIPLAVQASAKVDP